MTFNTALAVKVLAHIEDLREFDSKYKHKQNVWSTITLSKANYEALYDEQTGGLIGFGSCGTAGCFAGWTMHLEGIKLRYYKVDGLHFRDVIGYQGKDILLNADETQDGRTVSNAACDALGIPVPVYDGECSHGELPDDVDCTCELYFEHWDYDENMPVLFRASNSMTDIYHDVAKYAEVSVTDLKLMVTEEREKYVFDPEKWASKWALFEKEQVSQVEPATT